MLTSQEFLAQVQDFYRRNEIDVASQPNGQNWLDRQDAHSPVPECLGGTEMVPLRKDAHILYDLLVSEEVGRCVFYGHAKALVEGLPEDLDAEITNYFRWLYTKWAGANSRGRGVYRNPETGKNELIATEEAKRRGWVHATAGLSTFVDPSTGEHHYVSTEEAEQRGLVHMNSGLGRYRCPETGEMRMLTPEQAAQMGWVGALAGASNYRNLDTGEQRRFRPEEVPVGNWVLGHKADVVECPHCSATGGGSSMKRYHLENCSQREGSWRWFVEQMKDADPKWRKTATGKWVQTPEKGSMEWKEKISQGHLSRRSAK